MPCYIQRPLNVFNLRSNMVYVLSQAVDHVCQSSSIPHKQIELWNKGGWFDPTQVLASQFYTYCILPIMYCLLLFACCLSPIASCLLPIAHCQLPIRMSSLLQAHTQTSCWPNHQLSNSRTFLESIPYEICIKSVCLRGLSPSSYQFHVNTLV